MNGVDTTSIVNSEISVADGLNNGIRIDPEAGATAIQDVDIEIDGSANAVQIHGQDAGAVDLQDVRITGDADGSTMRHAILCTRNGCRFDELSVEQHGPNKRRGIELRGDDATVVDSEFTTTHTPIVVHGADDVTIENCYADSVDDVSS